MGRPTLQTRNKPSMLAKSICRNLRISLTSDDFFVYYSMKWRGMQGGKWEVLALATL